MKKILLLIAVFMALGIFSAYANDGVDMNSGSFVQDGDWIYYCNRYDNTLDKVKTDGTENTILFNHYHSAYSKEDICYDDEYIYCSNRIWGECGVVKEGIFRIKKSGSEPELIYSDSEIRGIQYIYHDRIIFTDTHDNLYSIKRDGTDLLTLTKARSNCFAGEKGIIYYSDYDDPGIYKIDINGQNKEKISNNKSLYMVIENGWLYYDNRSDDGKLYKMRTEGSENSKMNNDDCYFLTVDDGWVYYTSGQEGYSICKMNCATLEKQTLVNKGYDNLNDANGTLFFSDGANMFMVDINGGSPIEALLDKTLFGASDDLEVLIQGRRLEVAKGDPPPMMIDGSVFIPARAFADSQAIETKWDEQSKTVSFIYQTNYDGYQLYTTVTFAVGSNIMNIKKTASHFKNDEMYNKDGTWLVSSEDVTLDVPIQTIDNWLMVPLRAITEAFGYQISWYEDTKTAHVFDLGSNSFDFLKEAQKTQPNE